MIVWGGTIDIDFPTRISTGGRYSGDEHLDSDDHDGCARGRGAHAAVRTESDDRQGGQDQAGIVMSDGGQ
jgi:hypothetical protein